MAVEGLSVSVWTVWTLYTIFYCCKRTPNPTHPPSLPPFCPFHMDEIEEGLERPRPRMPSAVRHACVCTVYMCVCLCACVLAAAKNKPFDQSVGDRQENNECTDGGGTNGGTIGRRLFPTELDSTPLRLLRLLPLLLLLSLASSLCVATQTATKQQQQQPSLPYVRTSGSVRPSVVLLNPGDDELGGRPWKSYIADAGWTERKDSGGKTTTSQ